MPDQRARYIWEGLTAFANADLSSDNPLRGWAESILEAMPPAARSVTLGEWLEELDSFLLPDKRLRELRPEVAIQIQDHRQKFIQKAKEYQPKIRVLLSYLCHRPEFDPGKNKEVYQACDFLWHHETHVSFAKISDQQGDQVALDMDVSRLRLKRIAKRKRLYPLRNVPRYEDMVDPICKFIADQIEEYHDGYTEHLVPIVICRRAGCGKFVMPRRIGRKQFCDGCKERHHNKERRELTADQKWLYRLRADGKKDPALLRTKLKKAGTKKRVNLLKKRLPKLVDEVEALAK